MKFYQTFLLLSRGKKIGAAVCLVHILVILTLGGHHLFTKKTGAPRAIAVRTVEVQTKREEGPTKAAAATPVKPKPVAATPVKPKPKAAAPAVKKEPKASNAIVEKREPKSVRRPELPLPAKIERKAEVVQVNDDPTYGEYLIAYLQNALDLPEYGEVKAQLEIDRFGRLVDCQIVYTKSGKNAEFLKNQLPELTFPCLNDFGILDSTHIFTITFRNAE